MDFLGLKSVGTTPSIVLRTRCAMSSTGVVYAIRGCEVGYAHLVTAVLGVRWGMWYVRAMRGSEGGRGGGESAVQGNDVLHMGRGMWDAMRRTQ
eukprot:1712755-Rhodomonas_salina.1